MPKGGVSPRVRKRLERDFEAKRRARERERERARRRREGAPERAADPEQATADLGQLHAPHSSRKTNPAVRRPP